MTIVFKSKVTELTEGKPVVMSDYEMDVLDSLDLEFEYTSIFNPNRVGTKDTYLVTKKGA